MYVGKRQREREQAQEGNRGGRGRETQIVVRARVRKTNEFSKEVRRTAAKPLVWGLQGTQNRYRGIRRSGGRNGKAYHSNHGQEDSRGKNGQIGPMPQGKVKKNKDEGKKVWLRQQGSPM